MSNRIYPIYHGNIEIIYTDWRNIVDEAEFRAAIWETTNWVVNRNVRNQLEIVDVRGAAFSLDIFNELKKAAAAAKPFNRKKAIVAELSESRMLMLRFLNTFSNEKIHAFRTLEEAKAWVIG